jgi:hypothetical protein
MTTNFLALAHAAPFHAPGEHLPFDPLPMALAAIVLGAAAMLIVRYAVWLHGAIAKAARSAS